MKRRKILEIFIPGLLTALVLGSGLLSAQEAPQGKIEELTPKDARLKNLAEEKERKQIELTRRKEEKSRKLAEAKIKEALELKAKRQRAADSELRRQLELQEKAKQKEEEISAKREELERKKEDEQRLIAGRKMEREQRLRARQEELDRQGEERQNRILELQIERHRKLKARQEELARQREEKEGRLAELKARKDEEIRKKELEAYQKKEEEQRRIAESEERKQKELAREKEESVKQLRELKDKLEEEVAAKKKELARKKEERANRVAELKMKQDLEEKSRQEETARKKEEEQRRIAEAEVRKQRELAREKEGKERRLTGLKAGQDQEVRRKQIELSRKKEEIRKGIAEIEDDRRGAISRQEDREKKEMLAREKAEQDRELKTRQEEIGRKKQAEDLKKEQKITQQEIERQKRVLEQEAKLQQELKAKQEDLLRKKKELNEKVAEMKESTIQEKAVTEAMLKKHKEDEAKVARIENLWMKARRFYSQGLYEEAIKDFEQIIKLEGNPRIKYTPQAKEFIEKAKERIEEVKKENLTRDVDKIEGDMMHEVLKRQVPPYVEPPAKLEKSEEATLIEPPAIRKKLKEKKITMDFDKVDLKSVILFLSQESGINFVTSNRVMELGLKVTTRLTDTPLDEVVKYIVKSMGLVYRIDKEVVWIAHPDEVAQEALETRVYYLTKGGGLFSEFSSISGGTDTSLGSSSAQISKISTLEDTLKEVVPWPQDAKMTFDKRINALIVRNTPQNLQALEDMLYNLDVTPLQVLIEARFLEVNVTNTEQLGLEWKVANTDFPLNKKGGSFSHGVAKDSGVDFSTFGDRAAEGLNLTYKGLLTSPQFEAVLHALEESKKTKTLSSPRITTLNNQMATIKVVDEWLYPTRYEYEVVQSDITGDGDFDDAGETTYKNVPKDFLRRDVGILLKVIPSAGADKKTISLSLIPEVSEAVADGFTYTGDVKLPKFTSRNLSTTVVVNSGETVVLGGLIKESRTKTLTKVPFLGDIPFIGAAFRKNADSIERKNLLIFVTARILSPAGEEVVVAQK